jgi:hypothetical protein
MALARKQSRRRRLLRVRRRCAMRVVYLPLGCKRRANRRKRKTPKETHVALALNAGIITDV